MVALSQMRHCSLGGTRSFSLTICGRKSSWPGHGRSQEESRTVIVAIGDNQTRLAKQREIESLSLSITSIVHPNAFVSPFARIQPGTSVFAGAVVNPFAVIGSGCIVNTGASVDHDCVLLAGVHLSPGARLGGGVRVGEASWIGIGAVVKDGISIGANVRVGAGAAVVDDVADGLTVVGVPARAREGSKS
jgi:sugar O-acyltransferase (sialic acid O-acetyltransferase NeuD family)